MSAVNLSNSIGRTMEILNLSRATIYLEINQGRLKSFHVGRRRFISETAIRAWIVDRETESLNKGKG